MNDNWMADLLSKRIEDDFTSMFNNSTASRKEDKPLTLDVLESCKKFLSELPPPEPPVKFVESRFLTKTVDHGPRRTHRKKRIAKKWLKRYGRWIEEIPDEDVYLMDKPILLPFDRPEKLVIGHPETLKRLNLFRDKYKKEREVGE